VAEYDGDAAPLEEAAARREYQLLTRRALLRSRIELALVQYYGVGPVRYWNARRLSCAARLLIRFGQNFLVEAAKRDRSGYDPPTDDDGPANAKADWSD
jgi:hypothetical protein